MADTYEGKDLDVKGQVFSKGGDDVRGEWGYLLPSGRSAVRCGACGEVILETFGPEQPNGHQDVTTTHSCWV